MLPGRDAGFVAASCVGADERLRIPNTLGSQHHRVLFSRLCRWRRETEGWLGSLSSRKGVRSLPQRDYYGISD